MLESASNLRGAERKQKFKEESKKSSQRGHRETMPCHRSQGGKLVEKGTTESVGATEPSEGQEQRSGFEIWRL